MCMAVGVTHNGSLIDESLWIELLSIPFVGISSNISCALRSSFSVLKWSNSEKNSSLTNHVNLQTYITVIKLNKCVSGQQPTWTRLFWRISSLSLKHECRAMEETHGSATLGQPCSQTWALLEFPPFYSNQWRNFLSISLRGDKSSKSLRNYMFSAGWRYFCQLPNEEVQNREIFRLEWFFINRMHEKSHKFYILMPHHPGINNSKQNPQGRN